MSAHPSPASFDDSVLVYLKIISRVKGSKSQGLGSLGQAWEFSSFT